MLLLIEALPLIITSGFAIYPTISTNLQVAISNVVSGISSPKQALDAAWKNVMQEYDRMK